MAKNTFNRYIWLLNTLLEVKRITFEEISKRWQRSSMGDGRRLPLRTFHQHKAAVEDLFDVNIVCDPSDGYTYTLEDEEALKKDKAKCWLINAFSIGNLVSEGLQMTDRILFETIPEGTEYLTPIVEALRSNHTLEVSYQPFYEDTPTTHTIHPYALKVYHQRWYLLGYFMEKASIRRLALDRIRYLNITDNTFEYPDDFSPADHFSNTLGIYVDDTQSVETIHLKTYGQQVKYMRTLPLHHSQKEIVTTQAYSVFEYHLCVTPDLISELLSKSDTIEVLEPATLRKSIRTTIEHMLTNYD